MKKIIYSLLMLNAITACSQEAKQNLGLVNTPPDEFSVITRAPLSVPPDFTLRAPTPGAARPMEMSTQQVARQTVFGETATQSNVGEITTETDGFLNKVGVQQADPNIRQIVDAERPADTRSTAERLLFMSGSDDEDGDPINPSEELQRLRNEGVVERPVPVSSNEATE